MIILQNEDCHFWAKSYEAKVIPLCSEEAEKQQRKNSEEVVNNRTLIED